MVTKEPTDNIRVTSANQCIHEFELLRSALSIEETEDTWQKIDQSLKRFAAAVRGGACDYQDDFLKRWKETDIVRGMVNAISTERTRLSGTALDLMGSTSRLGSHWETAVPFYIPTIVKLLGRASKIYVTRASITLCLLIKGTKSSSFLPYLIDGISEKSLTMRVGCAEAILCCLTVNLDGSEGPSVSQQIRSTHKDVLGKRLTQLENAIKIGGRDRDPKVRAIFKKIWDVYEQQWPTRAASLAQPLTPTIRRYLGIGSTQAPNPQTAPARQPLSSSTSQLPASQNFGKAANTAPPTARDRSHTNGHQRSGSKNTQDEGLQSSTRARDILTKARKATTSDTESHQTQRSHPADLATLRRAMMVPLPPDDPHTYQDRTGHRAPGRAIGTIVEGSLHKSQASGPLMKRSNSTMRAQRAPLPSNFDTATPAFTGFARTATRAPLHPLPSSDNQTIVRDTTHKAPNLGTREQPSTKIAATETGGPATQKGFKPSRSTSSSISSATNSKHQTQISLETRPLPRRAVPVITEANPPIESATSFPPHVAVRPRSAAQKAPAQVPAIIKQTRKIFKPTKSTFKVTSAKKPAHTADPGSSSRATSSNSCPPTSRPTVAPAVGPESAGNSELPEALRIPVLTPLPNSPSTSSNSQPPSQSSSPKSMVPPAMRVRSPQQRSNSSEDEKVQPTTSITSLPHSCEVEPSSSLPILVPKPSNVTSAPFVLLNRTPGPKICTKLPDDLIVPMSIPLPPSPGSPYINFTVSSDNLIKTQRKGKHKAASKSRSRLRPVTPEATLTAETPESVLKVDDNTVDATPQPCLPNISLIGSVQDDVVDDDGDLTQRATVNEGVLVDFDHEDTVWIPKTPALHGDLTQLNTIFANVPIIEEEPDDGEDGPDEKRPRLESSGAPVVQPLEDSLDNSPTKIITMPYAPPHIAPHPRRREHTIFHWDHPVPDAIADHSEERTISCLKEQPDFLAGDVTVNDGKTFFANFISGISAQNQSTPASGIGPELLSRFQATTQTP